MPYIRADEYFEVIATEKLLDDSVVVSGGLVGITKFAYEIGEKALAYVGGEYQLEKKSAASFDQGDDVFYNETSKSLTATATDNIRIGICSRNSTTEDKYVFVFLNR